MWVLVPWSEFIKQAIELIKLRQCADVDVLFPREIQPIGKRCHTRKEILLRKHHTKIWRSELWVFWLPFTAHILSYLLIFLFSYFRRNIPFFFLVYVSIFLCRNFLYIYSALEYLTVIEPLLGKSVRQSILSLRCNYHSGDKSHKYLQLCYAVSKLR